jgi:hypothetical protein
VRGHAGAGFGLQAGSIRPVSPRVGVTGQDGVFYAHHTAEGTDPAIPGVARWRIDWRAPTTRDPVVFHVVANAANGDDSPLGDVILAREARVAPTPPR